MQNKGQLKDAILNLLEQGYGGDTKGRQFIYDKVKHLSKAKKRDILLRFIRKVDQQYRKECEINEKHLDIDSHYIKGISKLVDDQGNIKIQWIKTDTKKDMLYKQILSAAESVASRVETYKKDYPKVNTKNLNDSILCYFPIADTHFGLLANIEETQYDSDMEIMTERYQTSMDYLINQAPNSKTCLIDFKGDIIHSDNDKNRTPSHQHALDVDSRHFKIAEKVFELAVFTIDKALEKFENIEIKAEPGNHDPYFAIYLLNFLAAWYKDSDRVNVDKSPAIMQYYKFGKVLLGMTHGDKAKNNQLIECAVHDNKQIWSDISFAYIHKGHVHHQKIDASSPLATIESHSTLNTNDVYAQGSGYRAMIPYESKCIVYHQDYGEISRINFNYFIDQNKKPS